MATASSASGECTVIFYSGLVFGGKTIEKMLGVEGNRGYAMTYLNVT